jgi:SH3 domain-containing YSC84-like protein 1
MKKYKIPAYLAILAIACFYYNVGKAGADENKWTRLVKESGKVLSEVQQMPEQSIPEKLINRCSAIAIFPSTVSVGLGIGGKYGQGIIIARKENSVNKWSGPAIFSLKGGSIGWQIGGQATDIILLIMNKRSLDGILQGKFKLGVDAAIAGGPIGRDAEASADIQLKGAIFSYSRTRGLFVGIKLEGAVISEHNPGNAALYNKALSAEDVLVFDKANPPESARGLIDILSRYPYRN